MSGSGAVYLFRRSSGDDWAEVAYIKAPHTDIADYFGADVALSGQTLVIGAFGEDSNATGIDGDQANDGTSDSGAVYVRRVAP